MGATVVIVDDNDGYRRSLRSFVETQGCEVLGEATDGSSAVPLILALSPSLVLLDLRLPDISGFVVAERLVSAGYVGRVILVSSRRILPSAVEGTSIAGFVAKEDISVETLRPFLEATA